MGGAIERGACLPASGARDILHTTDTTDRTTLFLVFGLFFCDKEGSDHE